MDAATTDGPYEEHPVLGIGATTVADEVTSVTFTLTGVPGVIVAGHGVAAQLVFVGKLVGQTNSICSPFMPRTLSGVRFALNVAVEPGFTDSSVGSCVAML